MPRVRLADLRDDFLAALADAARHGTSWRDPRHRSLKPISASEFQHFVELDPGVFKKLLLFLKKLDVFGTRLEKFQGFLGTVEVGEMAFPDQQLAKSCQRHSRPAATALSAHGGQLRDSRRQAAGAGRG